MKDLLQFKGKNDYFHITSKRDFDEFIDICLENGITAFSSGKALDSSEYYNHDDVYVKIKGNKTLAFVNYQSDWSGRVHEYRGSYSHVSAPKATRTTVNTNVRSEKENKGMKFDGLFKGMGFDLVKTADFGIDLMTGKLAYINKDKAIIINGKKQLMETMPDMVKTIPLMCIPTAITALKEGDIIKRNNTYGMITKIEDSQIQIQKYSGAVSTETVATHVLMQTSFIPKLFNPFEGLGGEGGQMNPMMAMMFMDNDGDDSLLSTFMLMQAMQGGAGNNPQMAAMLPMLLMQQGGKDDMLKLMMFSGMAGGAGANPFASNPMLPLLLMGDGGLGGGGGIKDIMMMSMLGGGASPFGGLFGGIAPVAPVVTETPEKK